MIWPGPDRFFFGREILWKTYILREKSNPGPFSLDIGADWVCVCVCVVWRGVYAIRCIRPLICFFFSLGNYKQSGNVDGGGGVGVVITNTGKKAQSAFLLWFVPKRRLHFKHLRIACDECFVYCKNFNFDSLGLILYTDKHEHPICMWGRIWKSIFRFLSVYEKGFLKNKHKLFISEKSVNYL